MPVKPQFRARFLKGKVHLDDPNLYNNFICSKFRDNDILNITVDKFRKVRTSGKDWEEGDQNAYLHGVVLKIISDWSGHTVEELKEVYKTAFGAKVPFDLPGGKRILVNKSTALYERFEMTEFIERIRAEVAEYGVVIPDPENVKF